MKKQVCKDCYYAGFDKCDHVKKLTNKQEVMDKTTKVLTVRNGKLTHVKVKGTCSVEWAKNYTKSANKTLTKKQK
jgi:hypothetical protein